MSTRNRLKRLEKLTGAIDIDQHDDATNLLEAWYAMKLERFEQLRDEHYTPPTDEQRALVSVTSYARLQNAFRAILPSRKWIEYLASRRQRESSDAQADTAPSEGL